MSSSTTVDQLEGQLHERVQQSSFCVNDVWIYPAENALERAGVKVEVAPKVIKLLVYLANRPGTLVTYQELIDVVWLGRGNETSLYQQMAQLRKALGDSPSKPSFIKTVSRQGYRLIAPVQWNHIKEVIKERPAAPRRLMYVLIAAVLLAVSVAVSYIFWLPKSDIDEQQWVSVLNPPQQVVALQIPDPSSLNQGRYLYVLLQTLRWHLEQVPHQHVVLIPELRDAQSYSELQKHFSKLGGLSSLIRPQLDVSGGIFTFRLSIEADSVTAGLLRNDNNKLLDLEFTPQSYLTQLPMFERELMGRLQNAGLIGHEQKPQHQNNPRAALALLAAARPMLMKSPDSSDMEEGIHNAEQALLLEPLNGVVSDLLQDQLHLFLSMFEASVDVGWALEKLKHTANRALVHTPDSIRAQYSAAVYACTMQNQPLCRQRLFEVLQRRPYHADTLGSVNWFLPLSAQKKLLVNQFNYRLNPFYNYLSGTGLRVYPYHLQQALLLQRDIVGSAELINHHLKLRTLTPNWYLLANQYTRIEELQALAKWYREAPLPLMVSERQAWLLQREALEYEDSANRGLRPSRYIGYQLLSANQPDLAEFWASNGRERTNYFFDVVSIKLLANIWRGQWDDGQWLSARSLVEERREFQNTQDKQRIAYFNFQSGYFKHAKAYLLELYPELADISLTINAENFRYGVYYSEILKRQNDYKSAMKMTLRLQEFLKQLAGEPNRDVYFGIADVEFYALNGHQDKAIESLQQAIDQQWLPNAQWLWPNLDANIFLQSLRDHKTFQALSAGLNQRFDELCFTSKCGEPTR